LPVGAELVEEERVHFRVWAPAARRVRVHIDKETDTELDAEGNGYFSGIAEARSGDRYRFRLDEQERLLPDPASRFQPDGPHGASQIVNPHTFEWSDRTWPGVRLGGQIIYELHIGTFTREGTWTAAARELDELARLGISVIEVMPIAEFDGRFGWGYDGVDLYAPFHGYGTPDDLRRFVDRAHAVGIAVILDVVYNHLGPSGNYLREFSPAYFSSRYENDWGDAINFDGDDAGPVREFFAANAGYWIDEFHFDGLRLDATQQIFDRSAQNIMAAIGIRVREAARGRDAIVVAENEPQDARLLRPLDEGGFGLDGLWNDDFHHAAMVAITGRAEAYYSDTRGEPQEFVSAAKHGFLFQGQFYAWQRQPRGTAALDIAPERFITFLQNHDQVANSVRGLRGHQLTSPGRWRAVTAAFLLMPGTPMLFQGQEFSASSPFLYFADLPGELALAVRRGREEFLSQFPTVVAYEHAGALSDPGDTRTFERSKLDLDERTANAPAHDFHKDLIRLRCSRRTTFCNPRPASVDGTVLSPGAFALRYFAPGHVDDLVLIVNLGPDLKRSSFPEPLLAPPDAQDWYVLWSSEDPRYGGTGLRDLWPGGSWSIPAESAIVLAARARLEPRQKRERRQHRDE